MQANIIAVLFMISMAFALYAAWRQSVRWLSVAFLVFVLARLFPAMDVFSTLK